VFEIEALCPEWSAATSGGTVGVEEELLLVAPGSYRLAHGTAEQIVDSGCWSAGEASTEVCDSSLELISPIADDAAEAVRALAGLRARAQQVGATLMGAGLHPASGFCEASHTQSKRYERIVEQLRGVIARTPHCGMHVHVGMPDADAAIVACNGLRKWAPMLIALSANSPFWHGQDSGLASARTVLTHSLPRSGVPRRFDDYEDYVTTVRAVAEAGELRDYTWIWWDIRPHPRLGTVEIRGLDGQTELRSVLGLAALVHGLALHEIHLRSSDHPSPEALEESCFRALRDGDRVRLHFEGRMQPLSRIAAVACERARPHIPDAAALDEVERIVRDGNGARRQRRAHAQGGMRHLLRWLADATRPSAIGSGALPDALGPSRSTAAPA
jgi:glutamate---cysteine ligase / carboxylate-amine ligase